MEATTSDRRAYCAPEVDLTSDPVPMLTCLGISAHIESDDEGVVETSPIFNTISEVVEWARRRCDTIILRVNEGPNTSIYWRGIGSHPAEAVPFDQAQVEREYADFMSGFPRPIS